jgi:hypothetical protein
VFYYWNQYGSSVYFDELGPPWPKHPCTDNSTRRTPKRYVDAIRVVATYGWEKENWWSIRIDQIRRLENQSGFEISVTRLADGTQFKLTAQSLASSFCRNPADLFNDSSIVFMKRSEVHAESFHVSMLTGEGRPHEFSAMELTKRARVAKHGQKGRSGA